MDSLITNKEGRAIVTTTYCTEVSISSLHYFPKGGGGGAQTIVIEMKTFFFLLYLVAVELRFSSFHFFAEMILLDPPDIETTLLFT